MISITGNRDGSRRLRAQTELHSFFAPPRKSLSTKHLFWRYRPPNCQNIEFRELIDNIFAIIWIALFGSLDRELDRPGHCAFGATRKHALIVHFVWAGSRLCVTNGARKLVEKRLGDIGWSLVYFPMRQEVGTPKGIRAEPCFAREVASLPQRLMRY